MNVEEVTRQVMERLFVPLEASGRHVHVTADQALRLFGHPLTPQRELSQPGQFLARERVTLEGPKGKMENVAVLGPERPAAQVEVSMTDARALGIDAPVRLSGDTDGTPGAVLRTELGAVELAQGVIVARRHIHLSPEEAERFRVRDGQTVKLQSLTDRPVIFEGVSVRVHSQFRAAVHLDYDEANACGFRKGDFGRILL